MCKSIPDVESAEKYLLANQRHQRDTYATGFVYRSSDYLELGGIPPLPNLMFADDLLVYLVAKKDYKACEPSVQFDYRYHAESAARVTKMNTLFEASKAYLDYLENTLYMEVPEQKAAALNYVRDILVRHHRSMLLSLFTAPKDEVKAYKTQITIIRQDTRWSGDDDKIVSVFRFLLQLPTFLRRPTARAIRGLADITWQLRNRR